MTLNDWLSLNNNLARVAELMAVNGGQLSVSRAGKSEPSTANRYGRLGLLLSEAFELQYYKGIIDALTNAHGRPQETALEAHKRIGQEIDGRLISIPSPEEQVSLLRRK